MAIIRKIKGVDYLGAVEMIKITIRTSFSNLYSESLKEAICEKYDISNFTASVQEIEMLVAAEDDKIIGIIGLQGNRVRNFYVHPGRQGKGVGRQLYQELEKTALARKVSGLFVISSPIGESVYERFGFIRVGPVEKERAGQKYVDTLMEKLF